MLQAQRVQCVIMRMLSGSASLVAEAFPLDSLRPITGSEGGRVRLYAANHSTRIQSSYFASLRGGGAVAAARTSASRLPMLVLCA